MLQSCRNTAMRTQNRKYLLYTCVGEWIMRVQVNGRVPVPTTRANKDKQVECLVQTTNTQTKLKGNPSQHSTCDGKV